MSRIYISKSGDTLHKIMEKYLLTLEELENLNNFKVLKLLPNQRILIPIPQQTSLKLEEYLSIKNDTLESISTQFGIQFEKITYFNPMERLILQENQSITVLDEVSPKKLSYSNQ